MGPPDQRTGSFFMRSLQLYHSTSVRRPFVYVAVTNTPVPADTLAASLAHLLIYLVLNVYGRNECRRMVVARSNCSRIVVLNTTLPLSEACVLRHAILVTFNNGEGYATEAVRVCVHVHP